MAEGGLRLDKFLWFSRLTKTRGLAQATVAAGHCRIDGRVVGRAHVVVRAGNVLTFPLHDRVRVIRIEALPARRGPAPEARLCYTDLAPAPVAADARRENGSQPPGDIDAPHGRT